VRVRIVPPCRSPCRSLPWHPPHFFTSPGVVLHVAILRWLAVRAPRWSLSNPSAYMSSLVPRAALCSLTPPAHNRVHTPALFGWLPSFLFSGIYSILSCQYRPSWLDALQFSIVVSHSYQPPGPRFHLPPVTSANVPIPTPVLLQLAPALPVPVTPPAEGFAADGGVAGARRKPTPPIIAPCPRWF